MARGEDTRNHPNRKVSAHHMMGGEHFPHALSKVTTNPDGSSERTMIGVARDDDNRTVERWKSYGKAWAGPNTKWEYTHEESPD